MARHSHRTSERLFGGFVFGVSAAIAVALPGVRSPCAAAGHRPEPMRPRVVTGLEDRLPDMLPVVTSDPRQRSDNPEVERVLADALGVATRGSAHVDR